MVAEIRDKSRLSVRFAQKQDVNMLMAFINKYWKNGHILSHDQELFEFLYLEKNGNLNFVIATEVSTGRDVAILGFIPTNSSKSRVSVALWKAINDDHLRSLHAGLFCLKYLVDEIAPRSFLCVGIESKVTAVYNFLGYFTGVMSHHLIVNTRLASYKILKNPPHQNAISVEKSPANTFNLVSTMRQLETISLKFEFNRYGKDIEYLKHRYIDHPRFKYSMHQILADAATLGLIVTRRCFANNRSCLRIIDVIGGETCLSAGIGALIEVMINNHDEYIDLVAWGLDEGKLLQMGFVNRRLHEQCVVPEHFMPFVQQNKDISIFTNLPGNEQLFKGDGDMDRPN